MADRIPKRLRDFVADRAHRQCEYCLLHEDDSFYPHHLDHILSRKHGGESIPLNLAYACIRCNLWKGSASGVEDPETGVLVPLFNPRNDDWNGHFFLDGNLIVPLTARGSATIHLLRLNHPRRLTERDLLISVRRFPPTRESEQRAKS